jgi:hypothetical protein
VGNTGEWAAMNLAQLIPLAHAGHWLWLLYVPPVAVVVISIVRTTLVERRAMREEEREGKNGGSNP